MEQAIRTAQQRAGGNPGRHRHLAAAVLVAAIGACSPLTAADPPPPPAAPITLPVVKTPVPPQPAIGLAEDAHLNKIPVRSTRGLDLVKMGWSYDCMECHRLLQPKWKHDTPVEHANIKLLHGNNRFCLNCHHPTNRNAFVDYDGSEIAEANVVELCAKCHGPIHRDWVAGVHGRQNGYWDRSRGPRTKLRCIQCHDPHAPAFKPIKPLAPTPYPKRAPHAPATTHAQAEPQKP